MTKIVQEGEVVLRESAKDVPVLEIQTPKIKKVIEDMKEALSHEKEGVALAAPQIGEALRIFIVSGKIFDSKEQQEERKQKNPDLVFINPEILKVSKRKKWMEEGCLSVREIYGKVERPEKTLVKAYDENGQVFTRGGKGLLSQIFQHEMDHLNGILFVDKAKDLEKIKPK